MCSKRQEIVHCREYRKIKFQRQPRNFFHIFSEFEVSACLSMVLFLTNQILSYNDSVSVTFGWIIPWLMKGEILKSTLTPQQKTVLTKICSIKLLNDLEIFQEIRQHLLQK